MVKLMALGVLVLIFHQAFPQEQPLPCQICKNKDCYSVDGISHISNVIDCTVEAMAESYKAINEAYRQNYSVPENVEEFQCVDIKTTFILSDHVTEYFTYKGCVEKGAFDTRFVYPNQKHIREERRELFATCNQKHCNSKPIRISSKTPVTCYSCDGEAECQKEELTKAFCSENYVESYKKLTNHYGIDYRPTHVAEYTCFSIDSDLTGPSNKSRMVYKGCIEKGFAACTLNFNREKFTRDTKQNCRVCRGDLCNTNKVIAPLSCYSCDGHVECKKENLRKVDCEDNYFDTYEKLSKHYGVTYKPTHEDQYACLTIASNFTGPSKQSEISYKGCVEKGLKVCYLHLDKANRESQEHCKTCSEEFCNKNSAKELYLSLWTLIMAVLIVPDIF